MNTIVIAIVLLSISTQWAFFFCFRAFRQALPRARFYTTVTLLCWLYGILYLLTLSWKTIHP